MTMSLMRIWSSQGKYHLRKHVPIRGLTFDVDCHVAKFLKEAKNPTQTQHNFVSDVFFRIIVALAWFQFCEM